MITEWRVPASLIAGCISLVTLIGYALIKGYHHDVELMITVILVRLVAGFGLGIGLAIIVSLVHLARRKSRIVSSFPSTAIIAGSVVVTGTAFVNLLQTQ